MAVLRGDQVVFDVEVFGTGLAPVAGLLADEEFWEALAGEGEVEAAGEEEGEPSGNAPAEKEAKGNPAG